MDTLFKEQISIANIFLQENDFKKALQGYENALAVAETIDQKIDLYNVLGRLYLKTKNPERAASMFEESLILHTNDDNVRNLGDKAAIYNNLGAIYLTSNPKKAIENYTTALKIYKEITETGNELFLPHLANTNFALAEAYTQKNKLFFAKKHFKEAIAVCDQISDKSFNPLKASSYYNLGNLYTEEFNLHDAKVNYQKSLDLFEGLTNENKEYYQPYLASVYNNLGVTFKSNEDYKNALTYFEKALEHYIDLAENFTPKFFPYVAATYNSMGILSAEIKNFEKAILYMQNTSAIYNDLVDAHPEEYTHYLATSLHNLGLFYLELKKIEEAEEHFLTALRMRKKLALQEPKIFNDDVCATTMNLVELYMAKLENGMDFSYKKICTDLLDDVDKRLQKLDKPSPVQKTMNSDCQYYLEYFKTLTEEQLLSEVTLKKVDAFIEEINSTIVPAEKIVFQLKIVDLLEEVYKAYPENAKIVNELGYAYNDLSWLYIRIKEFKKAEITVLTASKLELPILPLKCNLAHSYLLQDKFDESQRLYLEFVNGKRIENEPLKVSIARDFQTLTNDGVYHQDFEKIKSLLKL